MNDNNQSSSAQNGLGALGDFFEWIQTTMQDDEMRKAILLDLGLDPNEEATDTDGEQFTSSFESIRDYQKAAKPNKADYADAIKDLKHFWGKLKVYYSNFKSNPFDFDKFIWHFLELMATNYIRLRYPRMYYVCQLLGFLADAQTVPIQMEDASGTSLVQGVAKAPIIILENLWDLITDPIDYVKNIVKKLGRVVQKIKDRDLIGLDTTDDAEALSYLFLSLPLLIETLTTTEMRYLFGWDIPPRKWLEEHEEAFKTSYHFTQLVKQLQNDFESLFTDSMQEEQLWTKLEEIIAKNDKTEIEEKVAKTYLRAIKRWERGEWTDLISETAFTFDIKLPEEADSDDEKYLGATLFMVSKEDAPTDLNEGDGISHEPSGGLFVALNGEAAINYALNDNWDFTFKSSSGNLIDFYLSNQADFNVAGDLRIEAGIKRKTDADTGASYNLPDKDGTRLAIGEIYANAFFNKEDMGIEIGLKENAFVISSANGDGFLKEIMPAGDSPLKFSLVAGLSKKKGFYFDHDIDFIKDFLDKDKEEEKVGERLLPADGRSARSIGDKEEDKKTTTNPYDAIFSIQKNLGIVKFENIDWSFGPANKPGMLGAKLQITTAISSKLGPVYFRVEGIGAKVEAVMPEAGGDLSLSNFDFGFVPPKRVGLRIEAAVITGGGYLEFDPDNHRYAGILALNFLDIELTAIGLINTRLPNNQKGFSMLLSINVIFNPSIQLAYGFTLNGVGGLIGIHRSMRVNVLQQRIRDGRLNLSCSPKM